MRRAPSPSRSTWWRSRLEQRRREARGARRLACRLAAAFLAGFLVPLLRAMTEFSSFDTGRRAPPYHGVHGTTPRVLVVEDDADIADVLRRSLGMEGYEVRLARDGEVALEGAGLFEPDAVVLDLGLPKLDGVEVAERLREQGDVRS